jgi:PhzF family phenazine biosynthesis protein
MSPLQLPFVQVDVFTDRPLMGNAVAVVLDGSALEDEQMQAMARWTNVSETVFVLPSEVANYRLRIFTPGNELPFAGHPTVGSAHAVLEAGIVAPGDDGQFAMECAQGIVQLRRTEGAEIFVRVPTPAVRRDAVARDDEVSALLRAPVQGVPLPVDLGPVWLVAQVTDRDSLSAATPDLEGIERLSREHSLTGITAFAIDSQAGSDARLYLRTFAPIEGIAEDPVCGSCNAAVGAYLGATGLLAQTGASYVASQGRELGRDGRVSVIVQGGEVEIGGHCVTVIEGVANL